MLNKNTLNLNRIESEVVTIAGTLKYYVSISTHYEQLQLIKHLISNEI